MSWWLCAAGKRLRDQIDERWPRRQRGSDGAVGDVAHSKRRSDHNPDPSSTPPGVVRAIDVTAALDPLTPGAMAALAEQIRVAGLADRRISYVIFDRRIASRVRGWTWRAYAGGNPHVRHAHVSFTPFGDHDGAPFRIPMLEREA